jgi:hypothetical protein
MTTTKPCRKVCRPMARRARARAHVVARSVGPKRSDAGPDLSFSPADIFAVVRPIGLLQTSVVPCSDITENQKLPSVSGVCAGINLSAVYSDSKRSYRVFPGARRMLYRGPRYSFVGVENCHHVYLDLIRKGRVYAVT